MKNNSFMKKSLQDLNLLTNQDKKFIINAPKNNKTNFYSSLTKRNFPHCKTINNESGKISMNLKKLNMNSNSSLNNMTSRKQIHDNSFATLNKISSPRANTLNKLKKYRYRRQIQENQDKVALQLSSQNRNQYWNRNQYCKIKIYQYKNKEEKQNNIFSTKQFKIKITTTTNLLQNLLSKLKNKQVVGFKAHPQNILLDVFLTFDNCDISYLNGTSLNLSIIQKNICPKIKISSLDILKCIGVGGFSKVFLCRFKQDGQFYALKMIDKKFIIKYKKNKIIMNERNIMQSISHPFVIKMKYAFQTANNLAFVLEYCPGGQMFSLIKRYRKISQQMARFYMIQILLGLQYLHKQGIIYRDFKPQNILIDIDGHIKIADFGLAKPNYFSSKDRAYSFCGSPQYMPPQMILKQGHSLAVDFYCLGAVLYELVTGSPPFYSRDANQIYQSTVNQQLTFTPKCKLSSQIKSLIKVLLCKQQKLRLGALYGVKQILAHPWFGKFSRQQYLKKQVRPPTNFSSINLINIQPQQFKQKNQLYVLQAQRQQQDDKAVFQILLKDFYYDNRFQRYQISKIQKENKIYNLQQKFNFKKKYSIQRLLTLNSQRNSCSFLKRKIGANQKLAIHRLNTQQTEHQSQKHQNKPIQMQNFIEKN